MSAILSKNSEYFLMYFIIKCAEIILLWVYFLFPRIFGIIIDDVMSIFTLSFCLFLSFGIDSLTQLSCHLHDLNIAEKA